MQNLHMELLKSLNRDYAFDKRNIDKKLSFLLEISRGSPCIPLAQ